MPDLITFSPLFTETLDKIRARLNADANPGLAPQDQAFLDTTEGGFWYDITQAAALEIERLYDSLNELAASMFLLYAWGVYLDLHGATMNLPRKAAVAATGTVTFTGTPATNIATGTQVATLQVSPDVDPIVFATTVSATIPAGGSIDVPVQALVSGSVSNAAAGSVQALLSPTSGVSAVSNLQPITGGADVETDELYRTRLLIAFAGAHGSGTIADYTEWALAIPGVGFVKVEPLWAGDGTVRVIITDVNNDAVSQALINQLQAELDPAAASTTLTADVNLPSGTINVGSTTGFTSAGKVVIGGAQVVSYTSKSGTALLGSLGGAGLVTAGSAVLQQGLGQGLAPIGAVVTVATPTGTVVNASAVVTLQSGFSLDGAGGTTAVRSDIVTAVQNYLNALPPGNAAIIQAVVAAIMDVNGVSDVANVQLNGSGSNVVVASLQVINAGSVTLS